MCAGDEQVAIERLRAICMALPEVEERNSHGEPTWFVGGKKTFVSLDNHHHGAAHLSAWCAAPPGAQETLIDAAADRFFRPPYVGHRGWVGVYLDVPGLDWDEVAMVVREAYVWVAPRRLAGLVG